MNTVTESFGFLENIIRLVSLVISLMIVMSMANSYYSFVIWLSVKADVAAVIILEQHIKT